MSETRNNTRNTTKQILATPAAAIAIPVNPSTAAINAIIKKVIAQFNIRESPFQNPTLTLVQIDCHSEKAFRMRRVAGPWRRNCGP
jgi:hypothetical protein